MSDDTRLQLDELSARLDQLEAENRTLHSRLRNESARSLPDDTSGAGHLSRRLLLAGGAAAAGAAAAAAATSKATAAGVKPVELETTNTSKYPTKIEGEIEELDSPPTDMLTPAFWANNKNATHGSGIYAVAKSYGVACDASGAGGAGIFARSEAAGQGVHAWVYGHPSTRAGDWTAGVLSQCSYAESPAFLAESDITLRTRENVGGIPLSDDAKPGDLSIRTDGAGGSTWWVCIKEAGRDPAEFVRVASPGAAGAFETLPAPIRVYDSRFGAPPSTGPKVPLVGPDTRTVSCMENTGGAVPADARAVLVNLTATGTSAAGFASVYPTGATWGGTSNLNFAAGQTIANSVTVGCGPGAFIDVRIGEAGVSANFIVDVMGFYR